MDGPESRNRNEDLASEINVVREFLGPSANGAL